MRLGREAALDIGEVPPAHRGRGWHGHVPLRPARVRATTSLPGLARAGAIERRRPEQGRAERSAPAPRWARASRTSATAPRAAARARKTSTGSRPGYVAVAEPLA